MLSADAINAIAHHANEAITPEPVTLADGRELALYPADMVADIRHKNDDPNHHIRTAVVHHTAASLIDHVTTFQSPSTIITTDLHTLQIGAVIDADMAGDGPPGTYDHTAALKPVPTEAWKVLSGLLNEWVERSTFAEAMYQLQGSIVTPEPLEVLELAEQINVTKSIEFSAGQKTSDGTRSINFIEEATGSGGGAGTIGIPAQIVFRLQPMIDSIAVDVVANFRYQLRDTELSIRLDCLDLAQIKRDMFDAYSAQVALATGARVVTGTI